MLTRMNLLIRVLFNNRIFIVVFNSQLQSNEARKIAVDEIIQNSQKTLYTKHGKLNKVNELLFEFFKKYIDFGELKFIEGCETSIMNFKIVLIPTTAGVELYLRNKSLRKVIKTFHGSADLNNLEYLKMYDVVTLMKQQTVVILINGTSGAGKSTVSSMIAQKFEIRNVFSTDFIRNMMRNFVSKKSNPLLHASTFEAGY